jgi:hypothetical protein
VGPQSSVVRIIAGCFGGTSTPRARGRKEKKNTRAYAGPRLASDSTLAGSPAAENGRNGIRIYLFRGDRGGPVPNSA